MTSTWARSSYCASNECVEVAGCQVRDSKDAGGPVLTFTPDAWRSFVQAVKKGELHA